jgi:hypothetical protein
MRKLSVLTFLITALALGAFGQQGRIDAGIQVKPVFSAPILRTGPIDLVEGDTRFTVTPRSGYVLGGVFRVGLWKNTALESGLSVAQRHYRLSIENGPYNFDHEQTFRIVGYELPISLLVFLRLGEESYMSAGLGACINAFPSEVGIGDRNFFMLGFRNARINPGATAGLGFEQRTNIGSFYIGATFQLPLKAIYNLTIEYTEPPQAERPRVQTELRGNYVTLDLKFFFASGEPK